MGELLLADALVRSLEGSAEVASWAVVVDAIDDQARAFYEHFEFVPFPEQVRRLFIPMAAVAKLFS